MTWTIWREFRKNKHTLWYTSLVQMMKIDFDHQWWLRRLPWNCMLKRTAVSESLGVFVLIIIQSLVIQNCDYFCLIDSITTPIWLPYFLSLSQDSCSSSETLVLVFHQNDETGFIPSLNIGSTKLLDSPSIVKSCLFPSTHWLYSTRHYSM